MAAMLCGTSTVVNPTKSQTATKPINPLPLSKTDVPWQTLFSASKISERFPALRYPVDTNNIRHPADQYAVDGRVMYRCVVTPQMLAKLCAMNLSLENDTKVNLVLKEHVSHTDNTSLLVSMVVGYHNARNVNSGGSGTGHGGYAPEQSNELQNEQFEQNLKSLNISYSKHAVLQVFNWRIDAEHHNAKLTPLWLLLSDGIDVLSYKEGENGSQSSMFIEVPVAELQRTIAVLSAFVPESVV